MKKIIAILLILTGCINHDVRCLPVVNQVRKVEGNKTLCYYKAGDNLTFYASCNKFQVGDTVYLSKLNIDIIEIEKAPSNLVKWRIDSLGNVTIYP